MVGLLSGGNLSLDCTLAQVCAWCVCSSAAIADDPDIRQLVLELKANNKKAANGSVPEDSGAEEEGGTIGRHRSRSRR